MGFFEYYKPYFEVAHVVSSILNILGWGLGAVLLTIAWRRNAISSFTVGPINIRLQEAVQAATVAVRDYSAKSQEGDVDVQKIRSTIERAFDPAVVDRLIGKSVLWVDDNPSNNMLVVRALKRLQLDVEEQLDTEAGLAAMKRRHFDLVISDMGRGTNMRAGYDLLQAIRAQKNAVPFLIFAGSDSPEFRREAEDRGAQLSTNNMLELMDHIIFHLGR